MLLEVLDQCIHILDHPVHAVVEFLVIHQPAGSPLAIIDLDGNIPRWI